MEKLQGSSPASGFVSGFVSIVGRPNAGKSTLLNALVGSRLAIVADKPQTTRTNVLGIRSTPESQIVFLDTPGIHRADTLYNRRMMKEVRSALEHRDLLLYVADALRSFHAEDERSLALLAKSGTPVFLILNKIDRLSGKGALLGLIENYRSRFEFREYLPISAASGEGLDTLIDLIVRAMPEGPEYFPSDQITDQPERFLAAELIREKILHETRQEIPHSVAVFVEVWEQGPTLTRIAATVYVERAGQKGIVLGSGGAMLKHIGTQARLDLEETLGTKVFLELFVKVREGWRENPKFLNELDWRSSFLGNESSDDRPAVLPE